MRFFIKKEAWSLSKLSRQVINTRRYMTQRYWLWAPPLAALLFLLLLFFSDTNRILFYQVNHLNHITGTAFWAHATILGDMLVLTVLILPWIRRRPDLVWAFIVAGVFAFLISHGVKHIVGLERPAALLERTTFILTGPAHKKFSYPSGHATSAFMIAALFILTVRLNWLKFSLLIIASFIALSRIAVGIHWPVDILGGLMTGWGSAWLGLWVIRRYRWGIKERGRHVLSVMLIVCAVALTFFHDTGYPQTLVFQRLIGVAMLGWGIWEYTRIYDLKHVFRGIKLSSD